MARIAIALGANLGDRIRFLQLAVAQLVDHVEDIVLSPVYESEPMYEPNQDTFYNAVLVGKANIGPFSLLRELKRIESKLGRINRGRNGPREIDLDIIVFGRLNLNSCDLVLPHQRLQERRFVIQPLLDVWPDVWLAGMDTAKLLETVSDQHLTRVKNAEFSIPRI